MNKKLENIIEKMILNELKTNNSIKIEVIKRANSFDEISGKGWYNFNSISGLFYYDVNKAINAYKKEKKQFPELELKIIQYPEEMFNGQPHLEVYFIVYKKEKDKINEQEEEITPEDKIKQDEENIKNIQNLTKGIEAEKKELQAQQRALNNSLGAVTDPDTRKAKQSEKESLVKREKKKTEDMKISKTMEDKMNSQLELEKQIQKQTKLTTDKTKTQNNNQNTTQQISSTINTNIQEQKILKNTNMSKIIITAKTVKESIESPVFTREFNEQQIPVQQQQRPVQQQLIQQKRKPFVVQFDKSTQPFSVKFSQRGFVIGDTRLSFELLERALSKGFVITLKDGFVLNNIRMQKILRYKDKV